MNYSDSVPHDPEIQKRDADLTIAQKTSKEVQQDSKKQAVNAGFEAQQKQQELLKGQTEVDAKDQATKRLHGIARFLDRMKKVGASIRGFMVPSSSPDSSSTVDADMVAAAVTDEDRVDADDLEEGTDAMISETQEKGNADTPA